ncbi:MAG: hypothetical protein OXH75_23110 [Acidobacteria bacterium]|nr:hypothetical protein [Acidobacteriota bacterium]
MTDLLAKAFARRARLSEQEQDAFARWLLDELESERRWSRAFHASQGQIAEMAREALADDDLADRADADVTRRLNELFADPELRREHLQVTAELNAGGTDWGDERW